MQVHYAPRQVLVPAAGAMDSAAEASGLGRDGCCYTIHTGGDEGRNHGAEQAFRWTLSLKVLLGCWWRRIERCQLGYGDAMCGIAMSMQCFLC